MIPLIRVDKTRIVNVPVPKGTLKMLCLYPLAFDIFFWYDLTLLLFQLVLLVIPVLSRRAYFITVTVFTVCTCGYEVSARIALKDTCNPIRIDLVFLLPFVKSAVVFFLGNVCTLIKCRYICTFVVKIIMIILFALIFVDTIILV